MFVSWWLAPNMPCVAVSSRPWIRQKVRHVGDGGPGWRIMYFATVDRATRIPSMPSSPWIRGAPHKQLLRLMRRMSWRTSRSIRGRPSRRRGQGQTHRGRRPARCHRRTVSASMISRASGQRLQQRDRTIQNSRSAVEKRGRLMERSMTAIWCRSAMTSSTRSNRVRNATKNRLNRPRTNALIVWTLEPSSEKVNEINADGYSVRTGGTIGQRLPLLVVSP